MTRKERFEHGANFHCTISHSDMNVSKVSRTCIVKLNYGIISCFIKLVPL